MEKGKASNFVQKGWLSDKKMNIKLQNKTKMHKNI